MFKYALLLFLLVKTIFTQTLELKSEHKGEKPGAIAELSVLKNISDNKIYIAARESINGKLYLILYDNDLNRLATFPSTPALNLENSFIRNDRLYYSDYKLKYLILSTLKTGEVNSDRKNISFFSIEKLNGKDAILASDLKNWFIFDVDTHTELLNIKRDNNSMNRAVGTIYNSSIYYTSESNELSRYDIKSNKVSWSVKLPDKAVKIIGIKLSSVPSLITCIMPFTKNNKDYIGVITNGGDYYSFDALVGKLVKNDIQYEKFNDISQNNSKLFVNSYIYKDKKADKLLIYAASIDKNVYCLNEKDFSTVWETPTGNEIYSPLTLLDINNDSYPEVFGVNDYDENLFVLDGKTGKKIVFHSLKEGKQFNRTRVYLADLHGTGTLNLIVKTNNEKIKVFELSQIKVPKNYISTFHTVSE